MSQSATASARPAHPGHGVLSHPPDLQLLRARWLAPLSLAVCCLTGGASAAADTLTLYERNTIEVFRKASPSVVTVTSREFRRSLLSQEVYERARGSGSGFIWDRDGHVVTNHHVIQGSDKLRVTLEGGETYPAQVVGSAPGNDLAVLRLELDKPLSLSPLPLGDSAELQVGRKVIAIGHPFGLGHSLSVGAVSALGREIPGRGRRMRNFIQTDAAINPGNSGGPLLDSSGRLVGVNTMIYTTTGGNLGIGFAIPVNTVRQVVPQLIKRGSISRPRIGVELLNDTWRSWLGVKRGVVVSRVVPDSPADKAGLVGLQAHGDTPPTVGDIILEAAGVEVDSFAELLAEVEKSQVGEQIELVVLRDGKRQRIRVRLYEAPPNPWGYFR